MDSFYITLPSNAFFDVYPDNTKSNYTTQFNSPLALDGNYEVALANITCTPNIKNDYGEIIIKNYSDFNPNFFQLFSKLKTELLLELYDAKILHDKINNQLHEFITFNQILLNSILIFNHFKVRNYKSSLLNKLLIPKQ